MKKLTTRAIELATECLNLEIAGDSLRVIDWTHLLTMLSFCDFDVEQERQRIENGSRRQTQNPNFTIDVATISEHRDSLTLLDDLSIKFNKPAVIPANRMKFSSVQDWE